LSPHEAAKRQNICIELDIIKLDLERTIVEGAGGIMVPLNKTCFIADLMENLQLPVILVARSELGTINHTLLTIKEIERRGLDLKGIIISGKKTAHNRTALEEYSGYPILAEIDYINPINRKNLLAIKPEKKINEIFLST
jgi:dethiobiotin synthetase